MASKLEELIGRLVRPEVRALSAYEVPDASGLIKLDAMENPYTWPDAIKQKWLEHLRTVALNRYPDPHARKLKVRLREVLRVPESASLLLGNGSDELIQIVVMALARPGAAMLAPVPTFVMYELIARAHGLRFVGVPLKPDFSLDIRAMREAAAAHRPAVIFLAYPNNPTGNLFSEADIELLLNEAPGLVALDEAYQVFAGESFMDRLGRYDNLLVLRTLSKQGLAGLRLGVLAGDPSWLNEFDKVRLPYNLGVLPQVSALFALEHLEILEAQARQIRVDREKLYRVLADTPGITAWPSRTNFILFRTETRAASDVYESLREAGVLVKNLDPVGGMLRGCLRVTVGTPAENAAFIEALGKCL